MIVPKRIVWIGISAAVMLTFACAGSVRNQLFTPNLIDILRENDQVQALPEYKDSEQVLQIKLENLQRINQARRQQGLAPVRLDLLASRVANKHCQEMVQANFISHWNQAGEKPYHRYAFAGGTDAVMENVFSMSTTGRLDRQRLPEYLDTGLASFLAEKPPLDGHRKNILDPHHTAVGLGCYLGDQGFAYAQEFLNQYVEMMPFPLTIRSGETIHFSGKVIDGAWRPFLLIIYYEPWPKPMSIAELRATSSYPDYTESQYQALWEQFNWNKEQKTFQTSVLFDHASPGLYYVKIYLTNKKGRILNSQDGIPVTGIVIRVRD